MTNPPPLPPTAPKRSRWKIPLIVIGSIFGVLLLIVALGALFLFTARDFEPPASQKETVLTVAYAVDFFEIDQSLGTEEWDCEKYIDGSLQIYYLYSDEATALDCTILIERNMSDAVISYVAEWQALKLGNSIGEADAGLEEANELFSWGDDSKFAFQVTENERYGFAFITRKGNKVCFVDAWGLLLEDPAEISAFLTPKLELFDAESYLK
ncbi:hypothetical protein N9A89_05530 [Akkermansiaceae bacterium]|nr:hypothetical protein [Akkermansiaceae bacterium]MDB0067926.1 hypothetical protein [Akkermansiaceae bacterium]MDB4271729.1 hypothetical protein [Akkermansiaceae bacterium]MDB4273397.1 hypothetical protein [Akkermansiaceae bacterium]MDB4332834.1 hypothetical protein [Akkermansiaceae bacterium]